MALPSLARVLTKVNNDCYYVRCIQTASVCYKEKPKNIKGRTPSSQQWITRQINDPFVKKAREDNYRCRSAYKLLEIDDKYQILKPGYNVIDCGAAPGSWSQVAAERVRSTNNVDHGGPFKEGQIISVDLQHIEPIPGVTIIPRSDFTSPQTQRVIREKLGGNLANAVLSDMAPSASGHAHLDHDVIIELCVSVLKFSTEVLANGGSLVVKFWMGSDEKKLVSVMERMFKSVQHFKPVSSRSDSAEMFLVGTHYFLRRK